MSLIISQIKVCVKLGYQINVTKLLIPISTLVRKITPKNPRVKNYQFNHSYLSSLYKYLVPFTYYENKLLTKKKKTGVAPVKK